MARYTGPKVRLSRKFGEDIFGNTTKRMQGRNQNVRRRKTSEYGIMLAEKQKAKYTYGVLEKQFRNLFDKAAKSSGITGEILLQSLECRLDNVVYRLGIAPTRAAARQLVNHKHITVDGRVGEHCLVQRKARPNRSRSREVEVSRSHRRRARRFNHSKYPWIEWDESTKSGKLLHKPERADIPENIKEQLIVELYSKN